MKKGLIQERIAFARKVDYTRCADVQEFIRRKASYEAFLEDCRRTTVTELVPDIYQDEEEPVVRRVSKFLVALIP